MDMPSSSSQTFWESWITVVDVSTSCDETKTLHLKEYFAASVHAKAKRHSLAGPASSKPSVLSRSPKPQLQ